MKPEKQNKHQLTFIKEDKNKYIVHLQSSIDLHFFTSKINSSRNTRWAGDVLKRGSSQRLTIPPYKNFIVPTIR